MKHVTVTLLAVCLSLGATAQKFTVNPNACEPTTNKEALKIYKKADKVDDPGERRKLLNDAIGIEPNFYEALFELGTKYFKMDKYDMAKDKLESVRDICPDYSPYTWYCLGMIAYQESVYKDAVKYFEKFLTYDDIDGAPYDTVKKILPDIKAYADILSQPVPFNPVPVKGVCTEKDEYLGSLSPDNRHFYFIRKVMETGINMNQSYGGEANYREYFTRSNNSNGAFDSGQPMDPPFNSKYNSGSSTITADNKHLFLVICQGNVTENCDIWYSDFVDGRWTDLRNMGSPVNSNTWDSHPTISYDGKTLIFSSLRPGGFGATDLYMSTRKDDGTWSLPVNLGPEINTSNYEMTPFLHSDSQTLYFSSKGHGGVGGYDIFYSKKDENGKWTKPKNLGYPINSVYDDMSFFVSLDGKSGFYSSDKLSGPGGLDIYSFELYASARPQEVLFIEGTVVSNTEQPVKEVELKNIRTKEVTKVEVDETDGKYVAIVTAKDDYVMTIKAEGVAFTSSLVSKDQMSPGAPTQVNLTASDIQVGEAYRLNDINFATNSYELTEKAKFIIEEFSEFLKKNPNMKIAIQGHTDDVGNDNDNLLLSDNRARAVYEYLLQLGVESGQLTSFKGYGETKPVASNKTEDGRRKNRRTEFLIISK